MENFIEVDIEKAIKIMIDEGCYRYKPEKGSFKVIDKELSSYDYTTYVKSHGFITGYKKNGKPEYLDLHTIDMNRKDFPVIKEIIYDINLPFGKVKDKPLFNTAKPLDVNFPIKSNNNNQDVSIFWNHLEYLCGDVSPEIKEWVKDWLCDIFQDPNKKKGTALVFIGGQGCGKGIFFNVLMGKLLSGYHHHDDGKGFSEKFNQELKDKLLINFDEGFASKSKSVEAKLKAFITESTFKIEGKGVNSTTVLNPARAVFTTNYQFAISTEDDDRRFAVFRTIKKDFITPEYFEKLLEAIENTKMLEKFMYELLTRKITSKLNKPPMTEEKKIQKVFSTNKVQDWFEFIITTPKDYRLSSKRASSKCNLLKNLWYSNDENEKQMYKELAFDEFSKYSGSNGNINSTTKLFHALKSYLIGKNEWSISEEEKEINSGGLVWGKDKIKSLWILKKV